MKKVLLMLALSGCLNAEVGNTLSGRPWWQWPVGARPVAAEHSDPAWTFKVDRAASLWSNRLFSSGCTVRPFDGSAGTQPVHLVDPDEYDADAPVMSIGATWTDRIDIRGTVADMRADDRYAYGTLVHEMGHALGLDHVSLTEDPMSVMHPNTDGVDEPSARDVELAMDSLGCR